MRVGGGGGGGRSKLARCSQTALHFLAILVLGSLQFCSTIPILFLLASQTGHTIYILTMLALCQLWFVGPKHELASRFYRVMSLLALPPRLSVCVYLSACLSVCLSVCLHAMAAKHDIREWPPFMQLHLVAAHYT
jgi:hypothetical protein